ncbi:hypothetical protein OIU77_007641 [Salix suchowensis]|uniref:Uncharacterized protein n=1 Tax=Salix suchowensis TaxID=1278906 RepID=A0ABQ9AI74_9ROSI|nr:hypothetical protein OIU77_007641 [Salix suchowensis]
MADFRQQQLRPGGQGTAGILPGKGPSTSQILAAVTLLPGGGTLLFLAALVIGLGVFGFLTSAAFVGHCALFVLMDGQLYPKLEQRFLPRKLDRAKWRPQEMAGEVDQQGPRGDEGWKDMRVLLRLCHYILGFEAHWPTIFLCLNFVVRYGESVP